MMNTLEGMVVIGVLAAGVLAFIVWQWASVSKDSAVVASGVPEGVTFTPSPLLTEQELTLYNLIRLAVQDEYLVFAHVPLWAFLRVEAAAGPRAQVFRQIALRTVDCLLVHPGSRQVTLAVQIVEAPQEVRPDPRGQTVQSVLQAAGIRQVNLYRQQAYTIPSILAALGLEAEEA